jgi:hypothetical protein
VKVFVVGTDRRATIGDKTHCYNGSFFDGQVVGEQRSDMSTISSIFDNDTTHV